MFLFKDFRFDSFKSLCFFFVSDIVEFFREMGMKIVAGERIYTDYDQNSILELIFCEGK